MKQDKSKGIWMTRPAGLTLFTLVLLVTSLGCIRIQNIKATEEDKSIAYDSLGTLEVGLPATRLYPQHLVWDTIEVLTLSFADTPSKGDTYKRLLRTKLAEKARERYGADAVVNVTYWPDPNNMPLLKNKIYARGEMIKYHPFPGSKIPQTAPQGSPDFVSVIDAGG